MNITGRPVYQKGKKKTSGYKPPTKKQRERWGRICEHGCSVAGCRNHPNIHHAETGAGGRKDHDKVFALCHTHHQGILGLHTLSRAVWELEFGSEQYHMHKIAVKLNEVGTGTPGTDSSPCTSTPSAAD